MECPIKVLFIFPTPQVWGGENMWLKLIEGMDRDKISISVLTFGSGKLLKRLDDINIRYYQLEKARLRNIFLSLKNLLDLIRLLRKEKFDIVNSLGVHFLTYLSTSLLNVCYILHIHTIHPLSIIDRWCVRHAKHIVTASNFSKQFLIDYKAKPESIRVIYNGINMPDLKKSTSLRKEFGLQNDTRIICYVGRIIESKNLKALVQAIPLIKQHSQNNFKVMFVGDTPKSATREVNFRNSLMELAKCLKVNDDIIFTGRREDVDDILTQIDLFAFPSHAEVCSMAILEAMAVAKPVVALKVGGNPEIVSDGAGILVEPNNPNEFAKAIINLLKDKEKAEAMAKAGEKRVKELFGLKKNVLSYQNLFYSIAKSFQNNNW